MLSSSVVKIADRADVGEARRLATQLAGEGRFAEVEVARVALVVVEAASNILKHAGSGMIIFRLFDREETRVFEMIAIDSGGGIADLRSSFGDGFSTTGTSGTGLGAIRRSADLFDIFSRRGIGTIVLAQIDGGGGGSRRATSPNSRSLEIGGVCVAMPGEEVSGDSWESVPSPGGAKVTIVDGLGHGSAALVASAEAVNVFLANAAKGPGEIIERMHAALRDTRGAAVGVASIDVTARKVTWAGVGNIASAVVRGGVAQRMVSHNGIVGHEMRKLQEFTYDWEPGALLLMQSDGLSTQWDVARYPGLLTAHPSIIAAVFYRDFGRGRDDATSVAAGEWAVA